jgi:hypothetical protein
MDEYLKAICIENHTVALDDCEKEILLQFKKMVVYDFGTMRLRKPEVPNKSEIEYELVYRLKHPDYRLKFINYDEETFKHYFSTEILKIQRKVGLKEINKTIKK